MTKYIPISNETLENIKAQSRKAQHLPIVNVDGVTHSFPKPVIVLTSDLVIRLCDEIIIERREVAFLKAKSIGLKAQRKK